MAKLDRLIGILTILLQQKRVTSPYLADRFEVSRRTIQRDIEVLCQAGIPVATTQGTGGGIEIMDGFALEKNVFTYDEMQTVLEALAGIDSVSKQSYTDRFMDKLTTDAMPSNCRPCIQIDLATYHKDNLKDKISMLRKSILSQQSVIIEYLTQSGQSQRTVEPVLLLYRWNNWYLYGYCLLRNDYRLFKLSRIHRLEMTKNSFSAHAISADKMDWDACFSPEIELDAIFDASAQYILVEEYGNDFLEKMEDGRLRFRFMFTFEEHLVRWLLSFGSRVEVLSPDYIIQKIKGESQKIINMYNQHDTELSC